MVKNLILDYVGYMDYCSLISKPLDQAYVLLKYDEGTIQQYLSTKPNLVPHGSIVFYIRYDAHTGRQVIPLEDVHEQITEDPIYLRVMSPPPKNCCTRPKKTHYRLKFVRR